MRSAWGGATRAEAFIVRAGGSRQSLRAFFRNRSAWERGARADRELVIPRKPRVARHVVAPRSGAGGADDHHVKVACTGRDTKGRKFSCAAPPTRRGNKGLLLFSSRGQPEGTGLLSPYDAVGDLEQAQCKRATSHKPAYAKGWAERLPHAGRGLATSGDSRVRTTRPGAWNPPTHPAFERR